MDCEFEECNLTLAKLSNTAFKNVRFVRCKMVGLHFENCNPFLLEMHFDGCQLNLSSFYKLTLKKTRFKNCAMQEVDFAEANFTESSFVECDLAGATFDCTILEKADFRTASNYSIDPENNRLKKAKFSLTGVVGLLHKYNISVEV
ncbi:pentapeptide repeat-containing protein [Salmonirosea aquatica]|uniref:pentapeptide repeat-containing protein n=1 Tax=Salmonirosea aquatica TaxID=2654236 RepID=UPI003570A9BE